MEDGPRIGNTYRALTATAGYVRYQPHDPNIVTPLSLGSKETISSRINNLGFRGVDVEIRKPTNRLRVVTLGASSTFGFGNEDADTYSVYLEQILRRRYTGPKEIEVINLGIPHSITSQIAALLADIGLKLEPDVVTFYEGINDSKPSNQRPRLVRMAGWSMLHRIYNLVLDDQSLGYTADLYEAAIDSKVEEFVGNLERMRRTLEEQGVPFVVISQQAKSMYVPIDSIRGVPYRNEVALVSRVLFDEGKGLSYRGLSFVNHNELMAAERRWAAQHEVPYVDGIAALDDRRDVLTSWVHLTPEGNQILAESIAPVVLGLLR